MEANAGTSFHLLPGLPAVAETEPGGGSEGSSPTSALIGHVTWGSGFTCLLSLSFLICHLGIFISAQGLTHTSNEMKLSSTL